MITLALLDGARHAYFTREGGVSDGIYASLNCGWGSGDRLERVARNRAIAMERLGLSAGRLVTCRQVHGSRIVTVEQPWPREEMPEADGLVTRTRDVALGILTADCAPVLFVDPDAEVVGAAHGGWRGALGGVLEATVAAMEALGGARGRIRAGIGPLIGPNSYEVGAEFPLPFLAEDPANADLFVPAKRPRHAMFDLAAYIERRLRRLGVAMVGRAGGDTAAEETRFFSYRRAVLRGEAAYGRALSAIALAE